MLLSVPLYFKVNRKIPQQTYWEKTGRRFAWNWWNVLWFISNSCRQSLSTELQGARSTQVNGTELWSALIQDNCVNQPCLVQWVSVGLLINPNCFALMGQFVMISITKIPIFTEWNGSGWFIFFKPKPEKLSFLNTVCGCAGKMCVSHLVFLNI